MARSTWKAIYGGLRSVCETRKDETLCETVAEDLGAVHTEGETNVPASQRRQIALSAPFEIGPDLVALERNAFGESESLDRLALLPEFYVAYGLSAAQHPEWIPNLAAHGLHKSFDAKLSSRMEYANSSITRRLSRLDQSAPRSGPSYQANRVGRRQPH